MKDDTTISYAPQEISISAELEPATRAYFEQNGSVYKHLWEEGDALSVFARTNQNTQFELAEGAGTQNGIFKGKIVPYTKGMFYAVYPYNEAVELDGTSLKVEYSATQTMREGSYDRNSFLMISASEEQELKFHNITSVVKISLTGDATISAIELKTNNHEAIAGEAEVSLTDGKAVVTMLGEDSSISLSCSATLTDEAQDFYIALPPVAFTNGFSVIVKDANGMSMTKSHSFKGNIECNKVLEMPAFEYVPTDKIAGLPVADMLDVVFLADGTAKDISPMKMEIVTKAGDNLSVSYDYARRQNVAHFKHTLDTEFTQIPSGFYQISYDNRQDFYNKLADGHTLECYCKLGTEITENVKTTPMCNFNSGGIGFNFQMVDGKQLFYSVHNGKGYQRAYGDNTTDFVAGKYYHLVGVWNKAESKIMLYIDGVNVTSSTIQGANSGYIESTGDLHVVENCKWICLGGDTNWQSKDFAETMWNGDILSARIYDAALTAEQVKALYDNANKDVEETLITNINYLKQETVSKDYNFVVYGTGFAKGDVLSLRSNTGIEYSCKTVTYGEGATMTIPAELQSGIYNIEVTRGTVKQILGAVELTMSDIPQADMLDVIFGAEATAYDGSSMQMTVISQNSGGEISSYANDNGKYYVRFDPKVVWGGDGAIKTGIFRIPYNTNCTSEKHQKEIFTNQYQKSHTLECVFMVTELFAEDKTGNYNIYTFGNHNGGGSALLLPSKNYSTLNNGKTTRSGLFAYSPNTYNPGTTSSAYRCIAATTAPNIGEFYHMVGTWNQETGDVILYVNGKEVAKTTGCTGDLKFPGNDAQSFYIGADPKTNFNEAQFPMKGYVSAARIYDRALSAEDITTLYQDATENYMPKNIKPIENIQYLSKEEVCVGYNYTVKGLGFVNGDIIQLKKGSETIDFAATTYLDGASFTIPEGFAGGSYEMSLKRGETIQPIGDVTFTMSQLPQADMLDVIFRKDFTAYDGSAMMMNTDLKNSNSDVLTYENWDGNYIAQFANKGGEAKEASGYYRTLYHQSDAFLKKLADGHSLETIVMMNTLPSPDANAYIIGSHDSGGTSIWCNKDYNCQITFAPHTGKYNQSTSGIVPEKGKYYHVVGVWDKVANSAKIYINGELKNSITTSGSFNAPYSWRVQQSFAGFFIGGDNAPSIDQSEFLWNGDIARARVYDKALTDEDVAALYADVKEHHMPIDWSTGELQKMPKNNELKIMSFNVRYLGGESSTNENYWDNRREAAVALIADHRPTILGTQEAQTSQYEYLNKELSKIGYKAFGITDDGLGQHCFYDSNVVELLDYNGIRPFFWLSETPDSAGPSKSWDTAQERKAAWGIFRVKATGKLFIYMNTHLDHISQWARTEGLKVLAERLKMYNPNGYPQIITGDLNMMFGNSAFETLAPTMHNARYAAPRAQSDLTTTWNAWGAVTNSVIDHIFCDKDLKVAEYHTITESYRTDGGLYVSDHYPVYAIIELE